MSDERLIREWCSCFVKSIRSGGALFTVVLVLSVTACNPALTRVSPSPPIHSLAGGCAGTVLTDAEPPNWSQGGWSNTKAPWPVPWALGTPADAVAFLFAIRLVAGSSPRVNGTSNKVLWVLRDPSTFMVEGRPLGQSQPVVTAQGGPSIVDVPAAGCWKFRLLWESGGAPHSSVINLDVLPAGTAP